MALVGSVGLLLSALSLLLVVWRDGIQVVQFGNWPAPFGITFTGIACSEPRLIALAYAFEQATKKRVAPADFP